jgi:hypothetical protein
MRGDSASLRALAADGVSVDDADEARKGKHAEKEGTTAEEVK